MAAILRRRVLAAALLLTGAGAAGCEEQRLSARPPRLTAPAVRVEPLPRSEVDSAEYAVLSALLRQRALDPPDRPHVVINDGSGAEPVLTQRGPGDVARRLRVPEALVLRYMRLNGLRHPVRARFEAATETQMVSAAEVAAFAETDTAGSERNPNAGWERFHQRFPAAAGIVTVSRVALSADGNTAVASYALHCGFLCGRGALVRMDRVGGEWRVARSAVTWAR